MWSEPGWDQEGLFHLTGIGDLFVGLFLLIPALIACGRDHPSAVWIWLLGLTGIGWIPAVIWALLPFETKP